MKPINRRQFVNHLSLSVATAVIVPRFGFSKPGRMANTTPPEEFIEGQTVYGKVRGQRIDGANIFKGIPYAGNVSGDRRFRRPAALEPWTGVRDALQLGAPAIQSPRRGEPAPSEDCLFLNVWTPANDTKKRPVMFYSHGGGYVTGSGGSGGQDGANLARNFDVVVVETNHRLGLLGFLYLDELAGPDYAGSGNMGILDITEGLRWVNKNIGAFGGDPNNVMIFGESGGGGKTSALYALPEAAPFFNKASIESGPGVRMRTKEMAAETTLQVLKELTIDPKDWRKILDVSAADLLAVQAKISNVPPHMEKNRNYTGFGPVVDEGTLPHQPFDPTAPGISKDKPLLVGWNEDEYTFFAMQSKDTSAFSMDFDGLHKRLETTYGANTGKIIETYRKSRPMATAPDIFVAISSINMMGLGSITIAERKAKQGGAPVYLYNFAYKSENKIQGTDYPLGTPHAMDIAFKFNNVIPPKDATQAGGGGMAGNRPERFTASHKFAELWTTFARTGKPSAKDVPTWPAYNLQTRPMMRIDEKCEVINDRLREELDLWRSVGKL